MTKREIENEILKELKAFMPKIKNVPLTEDYLYFEKKHGD